MRFKKAVFLYLFIFSFSFLFAQTYTSVPLEDHVYYVLEQAEIKGLCTPLSGVKPYSRSVIIRAINEILDSENERRLNEIERGILEQYIVKYSEPKPKLDLKRGGYYIAGTFSKFEIPISADIRTYLDIEGSGGFYDYDSVNEHYFGTEIWLGFFVDGDVGHNLSYKFAGEGGLMIAPRRPLGKYNTYYEGFIGDKEYQNQEIDVYSEPLTHFPYTYRKRWDASVHFFEDLSSFDYWPNTAAGAYNLLSELNVSFIDDKVLFRIGRLRREWGSVSFGSSLHLNEMARPFLGIEGEFRPFPWFSLATITGVLEFDPIYGIKDSGMANQKAFSMSVLQFRYKNYLFLDLGEGVVWPKRFELGYPSPITNTIFYQNNIGDFDNMSMMLNFKAQYPSLGNIWFSLFWDESWWNLEWHELDRTMVGVQGGLSISLPILAFTSIKVIYTVINPYCYTHNRNINPWYGDTPMETAYTNNGFSLGYYLPPNSDELLVKFETMPAKSLTTHLQYQLIRHGADYGSSAVDGSNLLSELDPGDRAGNLVLKRYFLQDGAYQWMHIIKIGGEWTLEKLPIAFFFEAGVVISFFTNIEEDANDGKPHPYHRINTPEYPEYKAFIAKLGFRLFP